jgi:hypothetical protein
MVQFSRFYLQQLVYGLYAKKAVFIVPFTSDFGVTNGRLPYGV